MPLRDSNNRLTPESAVSEITPLAMPTSRSASAPPLSAPHIAHSSSMPSLGPDAFGGTTISTMAHSFSALSLGSEAPSPELSCSDATETSSVSSSRSSASYKRFFSARADASDSAEAPASRRATDWKFIYTMPTDEFLQELEVHELTATHPTLPIPKIAVDNLNRIKQEFTQCIELIYYLVTQRPDTYTNPKTYYPHIAGTIRHEALQQAPIKGASPHTSSHHIKLVGLHNKLVKLHNKYSAVAYPVHTGPKLYQAPKSSALLLLYLKYHIWLCEAALRDLHDNWNETYQTISKSYKPTGFKLSAEEEEQIRTTHSQTPTTTPERHADIKQPTLRPEKVARRLFVDAGKSATASTDSGAGPSTSPAPASHG